MKRGIVGILNNPANSMNSHSAGWNLLVKDTIGGDISFLTEKDNWSLYDELYINHGPNFKPGVYNIIGGITDEVISRLKKLIAFKGKIFSVDGFDPNDFVEKRKLNIKVPNLVLRNYDMPILKRHVMGDSHSISVWPGPTHSISRNDGMTLYKFVNEKPLERGTFKELILYFGNIDVRFHLMRQPNPIKATYELVDQYLNYASELGATVVQLLPIENESRKLPGTGLYKGQPFYGSRTERQRLVDIINNEIEDYGNFISWPSSFLNDNRELSFDVMEPRQSVHIRPKYYTRYADNLLF